MKARNAIVTGALATGVALLTGSVAIGGDDDLDSRYVAARSAVVDYASASDGGDGLARIGNVLFVDRDPDDVRRRLFDGECDADELTS